MSQFSGLVCEIYYLQIRMIALSVLFMRICTYSYSIISQLENLKKEAGEVSRKMEETDIVMAEVERVSQEYVPLAASCSSIYFTIEGLSQVHFLYQFSLKFFLDVFLYVLNGNPKLKGVVDHKKRLQMITKELFQVHMYMCTLQGSCPHY